MVCRCPLRSFPVCCAPIIIFCLGALQVLPAVSQETSLPDPKPGRIEGAYYIGKTPGAGVEMILVRQGNIQDRKEIPRVKTDAAGRFSFEEVIPGDYTVGHFQCNRESDSTGSTNVWSSCHSRWVFVKPGETVKVQIGGTGRKLVGRMVAPEGVKTKLAWQGSSDRRIYTETHWPSPPAGLSKEAVQKWSDDWGKTDEYRKMRMEGVTILPEVDEDGTFSAVDVPPGTYWLTVDVPEDRVHSPGKPAAVVGCRFTVPPGEDGAVVDLGKVKAMMRQDPDDPKDKSE